MFNLEVNYAKHSSLTGSLTKLALLTADLIAYAMIGLFWFMFFGPLTSILALMPEMVLFVPLLLIMPICFILIVTKKIDIPCRYL